MAGAVVTVVLNTVNPYFDIKSKQSIDLWIIQEVNDLTYSIPPAGVPSGEISLVNSQQQAPGSTSGLLDVARDFKS